MDRPFNLYMYLSSFMRGFKGEVCLEFPAGNGKIDLLISYAGKTHAIELKTHISIPAYRDALIKAASYGNQLGLKEISIIFFVEAVDGANRKKFEADFIDSETGVKVAPIFVETGN